MPLVSSLRNYVPGESKIFLVLLCALFTATGALWSEDPCEKIFFANLSVSATLR